MSDLETPEADVMQDHSSVEAARATLRPEESRPGLDPDNPGAAPDTTLDHRACPWPGSLRLVAVFTFNMWARGRPYGYRAENPVRFNRQASRSDEQVSPERGRKTITPSCGAGDRPSERRSVGRHHRLDRLDYLRMGSD